ncbi:quinone oxidoreductase family protein [Actinoalloteichus hymeniacidonis]|uniref:Zn-dependent oxidoreductase, NADPH:quinone reductase n=1 Tax=Actinoalloteichus hymeniacidonis TaxID=340345 RepID=A0AAC9HMJ6_9PSEU|nr:zinc-binding dehydrogenase [Actinoalloteichus hymeniacidonis]AOS61878.1 Zn-dependent oxidoreductase, NADPH:quinone reductase [Actinoalloteichus hymeniacidonis]MBB5910102.1 NADPH:quinone reductase-like Zn-dependent oxidoreductase [Actinoalloteichus hymeniacidonis]
MTRYLNSSGVERSAVRIERFGTIPAGPSRQAETRAPRGPRALVRITHASVGVTDVMAARGDYLLQPRRGFVPGYDLVGIIEYLPSGDARGLRIGQRVAAVLPRMGAHATVIDVPTSLLVPIPDGLDSAIAATVPLDAVTAGCALEALRPDGRPILVQGAGGAVGSWAVQLASAGGRTVYGTASRRSREHAERFGATVLDYGDFGWIDELRAITGGGVSAAIDHTGSRALRRAVRPSGRIVRIAFGGSPGTQCAATAAGSLATQLRRYARPDERLCSVPMLLMTRRDRCRRLLAELLAGVAAGRLIAPGPRLFALSDYAGAMAAAEAGDPGEKIVLTTDEH